MNDQASRRGLAWAGLAAALLLLAFAASRAYSLTMARFWSESRPAIALEWRPTLATAVYAGAERQIRAGGSPGEWVDRARAAIRMSPLDGRGYRFLGADADARRDRDKAFVFYKIAADRSPRDLPSLAWLGDRAMQSRDFADAVSRLDSIMRIEPQQSHRLNAVLVGLASHPSAQGELARALASGPPWRELVLPRIVTQSPDSASLFPMMERLRRQPPGLNQAEMSMWLDRLAADRQWGPAYLIWVQSLSPEASRQIGNVYNGGFEQVPSEAGFDWRFKNVPGARVSRTQVTGASGQVALRVGFEDQRVPFENVRQLMALAPSKYRLSGRVRLDDLRTDRGLVWTLTCAEKNQVIGETEAFRGRRDWSEFALDFEVPATDCGGQWLTLRLPARIPAEQRIGGVAWFDDIKVKAAR